LGEPRSASKAQHSRFEKTPTIRQESYTLAVEKAIA